MKTGFLLLSVALVVAVCEARLAEKVSEDEDFVVYRIPVKALDLQSQATAQYQGYELTPTLGRSSSKSTSHSKSSSKSTGQGSGKGYGEGGSSQGHGQGYGGSSSGHGYGGSSEGHGYGGGSGGHGYGGGSGGQGYGGGNGGHGYGGGSGGHGYGGGSGGSGYGSGVSAQASGGNGYGGQYRGISGSPRSGFYSSQFDGFDTNFMNMPFKVGGGHSSYAPSYPSYEGGSHGPQYDDEEGDQPKVVTTTKTFTTNSAHDTGMGHQYRQPFRLGDYLKDAPGHEASSKYNQKFFETAGSDFNPGYRSGNQGFNVNDFTRTLNNGFNNPSYRNNKFVPQASFAIPTAYAFRNAGFGFPGF